jgi:ribonuclease P protein component
MAKFNLWRLVLRYKMRAGLKKYEDFKFCLSKATKKNLNSLIVCHIPREDLFLHLQTKTYPRVENYINTKFLFGILVSKKLGGAVKRNYFKRSIRASLKTIQNGSLQNDTLQNSSFLGKSQNLQASQKGLIDMQKKFCFIFLPNLKKINMINHQNISKDLSYFFKNHKD